MRAGFYASEHFLESTRVCSFVFPFAFFSGVRVLGYPVPTDLPRYLPTYRYQNKTRMNSSKSTSDETIHSPHLSPPPPFPPSTPTPLPRRSSVPSRSCKQIATAPCTSYPRLPSHPHVTQASIHPRSVPTHAHAHVIIGTLDTLDTALHCTTLHNTLPAHHRPSARARRAASCRDAV